MVQHGDSLAREAGDAGLAEAVASGEWDGFSERLRALLRYAVALTVRPADVREEDVETLRRAGLDDRAIVDANQAVSYFNYVNRIADGLGVELETDWPEHLRRERSYALGSTATLPVVAADALPWLSVEQMREVDRIAVGEIGLDLVRMMENAGRNLAVLARLVLGGDATRRRVLVLAGPGGNGGGLVAARHLAAAGASVSVSLATAPGGLAPQTRDQLAILSALGIRPGEAAADPDLVLDALLGYGQSGPPRGRFAALVEWTRGRRTVSLDVPTGIDLHGQRTVRAGRCDDDDRGPETWPAKSGGRSGRRRARSRRHLDPGGHLRAPRRSLRHAVPRRAPGSGRPGGDE